MALNTIRPHLGLARCPVPQDKRAQARRSPRPLVPPGPIETHHTPAEGSSTISVTNVCGPYPPSRGLIVACKMWMIWTRNGSGRDVVPEYVACSPRSRLCRFEKRSSTAWRQILSHRSREAGHRRDLSAGSDGRRSLDRARPPFSLRPGLLCPLWPCW